MIKNILLTSLMITNSTINVYTPNGTNEVEEDE